MLAPPRAVGFLSGRSLFVLIQASQPDAAVLEAVGSCLPGSSVLSSSEDGPIMQLTFEDHPEAESALIVHLAGSLDVDGATVLWETASQLVDHTTRFLVFDFTKITMMTSAGIGSLVRLHTRLHGLGGALAIYGCSSKVREIFSIVMLDKILAIRDSESEAWQALDTL
jgi:anti-anti-sigma factor